MRPGGLVLLIGAALGATWWWAGAAPQAEQGQPPAWPAHGYAGAEVCFVCHIDFARRWALLDHSQELMKRDRPADLRGCEACHGPSAAHVAGERKKTVRWEKLEPGQQADICLKCHQDVLEADRWRKGKHAAAGLSCTFCHEVHKPLENPSLLKQPLKKVCLPCHNLREEEEAQTHHPLFGGLLPCTACHNVHGTPHQPLLKIQQDALCADCHGKKVPQPKTHQRAQWRLKHRAEAQTQRAQCLMCHSEQGFCNRCHVVPLPHPENFALKHASPSRKHTEVCLLCHQKNYCQICHLEVPAPQQGEAE
ncbi:MAG TPA: hypothetical protein EYP85_04450 [Armatimonadetes bacterium]|nr:hypothetical protein [Armatimonadota bacterium]